MFSTGLAEEALTAGPRTTEADGEAAKHQSQQTVMWVQIKCHRSLSTQDTIWGPWILLGYLSLTIDLVAATLTSLTTSVTEKGVSCRRLKDQLDILEKETTDKLAQMEQYNKELKVSDEHRADQEDVEGGVDIFSLNLKGVLDHLNFNITQI